MIFVTSTSLQFYKRPISPFDDMSHFVQCLLQYVVYFHVLADVFLT